MNGRNTQYTFTPRIINAVSDINAKTAESLVAVVIGIEYHVVLSNTLIK